MKWATKMAFVLKEYQKNALATLEAYLEAARVDGPSATFAAVRGSEAGPAYKSVEGMESTPYVCLRLPTGGGKTVLASHAVAIAGRAFLEQEYPVVLWLVPTNTIREQTLDALRKVGHPYRQALDDAFGGQVAVFDISEVERIRPQDLASRVCLVVGTLATLRVNNTEGRKIYAHNENFEPHFAAVPPTAEGLERIEDGPDRGKIKFSFANLLHRYRPLVIMDEAHNARTALTFEVLQRISPACIVEFTATPDTRPISGSNVLFRVSAAELKAEEMIKLPILLTEHANWQEAVHDAVRTRTRLAELADGERPDFLRPIVLFQAESKDREVTVDVLRQHLIVNEKIPADRIAVATGSQRELDGIDLFDLTCRIEHIITVEALKEGWDCSFAYVFCSAANIHSSKDVEQILGRVLRMPYARKRRQDELNRAYAHVSSPAFAQAAEQIKDRLVAMGFEEEEANAYVQPGQLHLPGEGDTSLLVYKPEEPLRLLVREAVDLSVFSPEEREMVRQVEKEPGVYELEVIGAIPETLQEKIVRIVPEDRKIEVTRALQRHRYAQQRAPSPAERGEKFQIPRLCLWVQGELELAEKELFLDAGGWNPLDFPAMLTEAEFAVNESARTFEVDVQGKRVVYGLVNGSHQLDLGHLRTEWTDLDLARWLDRKVHQPDIRQETLLEFLRRTVAHLTETRRIPLDTLVRGQYILVKALLEKIAVCRQRAYERGYQETLFGPRAAVETSYRFAFDYSKDNYPARLPYKGAYKFRKHFYSLPGELEPAGEEFECARAVDGLPEVKQWVRNLALQPAFSFWLPTSTDRFYPDFVAELTDGRILVVEYKGEHIADSADTREKRNLGALWEEKSGGKGLFLMAEKRDSVGRGLFRQLVDKIRRES
jgi:type III restriction enzyme